MIILFNQIKPINSTHQVKMNAKVHKSWFKGNDADAPPP